MTTIGTTWTINQTICKLDFHLFERSTTFNMQKQGHIFVTFFHLKDPKTVTRYSPVFSIRAPWSVLIYRGAAISIGASKRVSSITSIPPCRVNQQEICYDQILWGIPIYDQWEEVSPESMVEDPAFLGSEWFRTVKDAESVCHLTCWKDDSSAQSLSGLPRSSCSFHDDMFGAWKIPIKKPKVFMACLW